MGGRRGDLEGVIGWVNSKLKVGASSLPNHCYKDKIKTPFKTLFRK